MSRDLVRMIQQLRKDANLDISDHIRCVINISDDKLKKAILEHEDYIKEQTLCHSLEFSTDMNDVIHSNQAQISGQKIEVGISK